MRTRRKSNGEALLKRALVIIERRWSCRILHALLDGERSFSELHVALETITPRMLSRRLHEFEVGGIVAVRSERRPYHVFYRVKGSVKELREMLAAIRKWGQKLR